MKLNELTAHEVAGQLRQGEVSAVEVTRSVLDQIEAVDPTLNAFITVDADGALAQASEVDARRGRGEPLGALAGIPVAVKDVICVRGARTTCGSGILEDYVAPYDATAVGKLRNADAVIVGKTNMDEFAMGSSTENSHFGPTRNPADPDRVPGGSSGGSAAAVAAHETLVALGSDTGGSVRQPAGYCGVVGLKPTYGRISRYGLVAYASSLDQIGPVTKDVEDAALLLGVIAGHDPRDSTSIGEPVPEYCQKLEQGVEGLKIGLAREYFGEGLNHEIRSAVESAAEALQAGGAQIVEVSLPVAGDPEYCIGTYYIIAMGEASANLARYDGVKYGLRDPGDGNGRGDLQNMYCRSRSRGFGDEVKRRIMLGTYVLSAGYYDAYYLKAQKVRTLIRQDFDRAFGFCDLLLSPVAPTTAFRLGEQVDDPLQMYLNDIYTVSVNLAGIPGISVPVATSSEGLPIGAQLLAPPLGEEVLLRAARALELASPPSGSQ
ncbi:Asp-tRNA(Asn)/Glu-tRNA(Gln) amidotransferase subunit GatA [Candidatus Latescibacterota bacterium]